MRGARRPSSQMTVFESILACCGPVKQLSGITVGGQTSLPPNLRDYCSHPPGLYVEDAHSGSVMTNSSEDAL